MNNERTMQWVDCQFSHSSNDGEINNVENHTSYNDRLLLPPYGQHSQGQDD
jgi:hypothetical protein